MADSNTLNEGTHIQGGWWQKQGRIAGEEFYVPVVIDDSSIPARREPRIFRNIQVTFLPGGEVTPEFGQHMRALQEKHRATAPLQ